MPGLGAGDKGAPTKATTLQQAGTFPGHGPLSNHSCYGPGMVPMPLHGDFPSPIVGSGPQPYPYPPWGPQHLMGPYMPHPYPAMYGHPSIPPGSHLYSLYALRPGSTIEAQGNTTLARMLTGPKSSESGKGSLSPDCVREGSEGTSQDGSNGGHKGVDKGKQVMGAPTRGKHTNPGATSAIIPSKLGPGRDVVTGDQDEKECKRQRRKQSNRESARQSSLRKQAEYAKVCSLEAKVCSLEAEKTRLQEENTSLQEQNTSLRAENASLASQLNLYTEEYLTGIEPEPDTKSMNLARGT